MSNHPLKDSIRNFQDGFIPTVPEGTMSTIMSEQQKLIESGIAESSINVGNLFPGFDLRNADNKQRDLKELLSEGPLVISFYRGAWCPYCNLEINALQKALPEISATGARLIAITPQTPDKSEDQITKSKLDFEILSDFSNKLAKQCGLVFTLPEAIRPIYAAWELDIPGHNGDNTFELPIPATYVIDKGGIIRYSFVCMDYTQRSEPNIIIEQLKKL